jgi:hypothetical protein
VQSIAAVDIGLRPLQISARTIENSTDMGFLCVTYSELWQKNDPERQRRQVLKTKIKDGSTTSPEWNMTMI